MIDPQRILEDLTGSFAGELRFDPLSRAMYASDASLYEITPLGVAYPRSRDDVVALSKYCSEQNIPLTPRGAGTNVAGNSLGEGIIVDLSRHFTAIEEVTDKSVRVQVGVVRDTLNRKLREVGRYLPPDPSTTAVTTVGGMLAVDAAGSHAVRVGSMRDYVRSIEVVLPGGAWFEAKREPLTSLFPDLDPALMLPGESIEAKRSIVSRLTRLLRDNEALIRERQPPLLRNCAGYSLRSVLSRDDLNLPRLLVGSEGTLGIFTEATLHTSPLPAHRGVALLLFGQLESAIRVVHAIADQQPSACDLMDRRLLSLARESDPRFEAIIPKTAEAALIVEQTGFTERQVKDRVRAIIEIARHADSSLLVAQQAFDEDGVEFLWSLPSRVVPLLIRLKGHSRPLPIIEGLAIPPQTLRDFLLRAQKVLQKHEVTASLYAHAASGQIHLRPIIPFPTSADGHKLEALARELYEVVFSFGGTISGEHGDGLSRTAFLRSQYGPLYRVFQDVKSIFDPRNLMNPGKIVCDDPHLTVRNFRPAPLAVEAPAKPAETVSLQLKWSPEELSSAASQCNGCGNCRTQDADLRMCPFFRLDPIEEASPRSKANVVRSLMTGELSARDMSSEGVKRLAKLCFNCKQCELECPANVDIPHLMIEARAAYVAENGLSRADWILARAHSFGALGCSIAPLANWVLGSRTGRWLVEKILHVARRRRLPPFARRTFLRQAKRDLSRRELLQSDPRPVVYFVDHFANYHDPELGWAAVAILQHHGIPVYVPPGQTASGMAMIAAGDLELARELAEQNLRELAELAREGMTILCTEPTAAVCLKQEYPLLLNHPDTGVVASQVVEIGAFLQQLHREGRLKTDFTPMDLTVGYHTPCHLKALQQGTPLADLVGLIPGVKVERVNGGCSGMAGAYGLTVENFQTSLKLGQPLFEALKSPTIQVGSTECGSCKMQMEQGNPRATLHPLKLLALAYGLMPELRAKLRPSGRRLLTT